MAVLKANKRQELGTRQVRRLRAEGLIPGIVYGHQQEPQAITISEHDVALAVQHGERLLELKMDKAKENVLIKEIQYDTFGQHILHVDLARVSLDERVEVTVPIVLRGTPAAEEGVVGQMLSDLTINCLVTAIPEEIRLSVNEMNIGDAIRAGDIELPGGAELAGDADAIVCTITVIAEEVEEVVEAEEAAAEPEVIGEVKEEESADKQAEES